MYVLHFNNHYDLRPGKTSPLLTVIINVNKNVYFFYQARFKMAFKSNFFLGKTNINPIYLVNNYQNISNASDSDSK